MDDSSQEQQGTEQDQRHDQTPGSNGQDTKDSHKSHRRPHELIPDYIKDRGRIDVSGVLC